MARRDQVCHASFGRTRGKVQARGQQGPLAIEEQGKANTQAQYWPSAMPLPASHCLTASTIVAGRR